MRKGERERKKTKKVIMVTQDKLDQQWRSFCYCFSVDFIIHLYD